MWKTYNCIGTWTYLMHIVLGPRISKTFFNTNKWISVLQVSCWHCALLKINVGLIKPLGVIIFAHHAENLSRCTDRSSRDDAWRTNIVHLWTIFARITRLLVTWIYMCLNILLCTEVQSTPPARPSHKLLTILLQARAIQVIRQFVKALMRWDNFKRPTQKKCSKRLAIMLLRLRNT